MTFSMALEIFCELLNLNFDVRTGSHDTLELNIISVDIIIIVCNKLNITTRMEDLVPPQIKDNCKLALPDGLKELMSDITREVLRYQPRDLYKFIADYLSAMLLTRDNLSIAGYICSDIANCNCRPELHDELRAIGLSEEDINTASHIIVNYLENGKVNEGNLLMILVKDTKICDDMLSAVQDAIRNAYLRHQAHNTTKFESSSDSEQDDMMCAAKHTLDLYRQTAPNEETYAIMAEKIQKSYRAYGVRRDSAFKSKHTKPADKSVILVDLKLKAQTSTCPDIAFPKTMYSGEAMSMASSAEDREIQISMSMKQNRIATMSSTSLAGSFMTLPSYKPYSAHDSDILSDLDEFPEKEHGHIDYTVDNPHFSMVTEDKLFYKRNNKKISFNEVAKKMGLEADDDSESKDSNQNGSMVGADSDIFYRGDVKRLESNYDDTEMKQSDRNISGSRGKPT